MIKVQVDKIASVTKNVPLRADVRLSTEVIAKEGYIVCGRIHGEKSTYNLLENCQGRMVSLQDGDIVVGALGHRNALHGYAGIIPESIAIGDRLQVLNTGGVIGQCTSYNLEVGKPFDFEVLGSVLVFPELQNRSGVQAHTKMNSLKASKPLASVKKTPIIFIAGTCMNSGKTYVATQLIRLFHAKGVKIGAAKLTGVSLQRDTLSMMDHGADYSASFSATGVVTTGPDTALESSHTVLSHLSDTDCEVIFAELGDGIMGVYGVQNILMDPEICSRIGAFIFCANDPVGAWGGKIYLSEKFGIDPDVISGPLTDNLVGCQFVEDVLAVGAANARSNPKQLANLVQQALGKNCGFAMNDGFL